ncbi:MAG: hypothetical protein QXL17_05680 [Candidatus Thermoplasmatota archaeon]
MGENNSEQLLKDAIYWHLIGLGYTEFQAEVEAQRRLKQQRQSEI